MVSVRKITLSVLVVLMACIVLGANAGAVVATVPTITISQAQTVTGDSGNAAISVTAVGPASAYPYIVSYSTHDGSATDGVMYTKTAGTLTFTANGTQTINVPIINNDPMAQSGTFTVSANTLTTSVTVAEFPQSIENLPLLYGTEVVNGDKSIYTPAADMYGMWDFGVTIVNNSAAIYTPASDSYGMWNYGVALYVNGVPTAPSTAAW